MDISKIAWHWIPNGDRTLVYKNGVQITGKRVGVSNKKLEIQNSQSEVDCRLYSDVNGYCRTSFTKSLCS